MSTTRNRTDEDLFFEPHAAAQSQRSWWTRMASTIQCIDVRLSRTRLEITPRALAGWVIRLLGLDLRHEVPIDRITSARHVGDWHSYGKVLVAFDDDQGNGREVLLYLKNHREFLTAFEQLDSSARS